MLTKREIQGRYGALLLGTGDKDSAVKTSWLYEVKQNVQKNLEYETNSELASRVCVRDKKLEVKKKK